jgi:putative transposase
VTEHPTAAWTAQQIVHAFPDDSAPRYLLRDRDQVYGEQFRHRVNGMRIDEAKGYTLLRRSRVSSFRDLRAR